MCMLMNNDDIVLSVCLELHGANAYCYILASSLRPYSLLHIKKHNANRIFSYHGGIKRAHAILSFCILTVCH